MPQSQLNEAHKCSVQGCFHHAFSESLCRVHLEKSRLLQELQPKKRISLYLRDSKTGKNLHVLVAERALGKPLPKGAVVHHVNENPRDNRGENLVICPNEGYHKMLHQRTRAYDACGHAHWLKCQYCKKHDDPANLVMTRERAGYHRECGRKPKLVSQK